jgi:hypothetical protein
MRTTTWFGAAAIAALSTVSATSLAVAQERQNGHEGMSTQQQMEKGGHATEAHGIRKQSAQNQSPGEERLRNERTGQGQPKMGQEKMGQKPGEENKANEAQTEKMNNEKETGQNNVQNKTENSAAQTGEEKGKTAAEGQAEKMNNGKETGQNNVQNKSENSAAQTHEEKGKAAERADQNEKGKTAAEGQTERRAGEAQAGRNETQNNRQGQENAARETHVNPQNVRAEGNAHLSNDRAAKIADTLMATNRENVNINVRDIRIGAALPGNVNLVPLPATIVGLVPEYRGYDYFVANDEIVIVQPSTRNVVEVINAGGGEAMNEGAQAMASTHLAPCGNP